MKKILFSCLIGLSLFAKDSTFIEDLISEVKTTLDSNLTQEIKLENVENYIKNLKFNDKVDTSKYKLNVMGHYENYMLLGGHCSNNLVEKYYDDNGLRDSTRDYKRDSNEAQFQLSIKVPLYSNFLSSGADLFTAYTQNSYWQVYDTDHSSPFRETNYMPELFLDWKLNKKFGDSYLKEARFSLIHQSNGQDVGKSRSWNRTELFFLFQNENIFYGLNMWDRWNEDSKPTPTSTKGDDNVELEDYIGNQKYFIKYKGENINFTLAHQNQLFNYDINRGNTKVDLTFPSINSNFDFFIRYFNGYGESLIDYDVKIQRVSFGIMIADWI